MLVLKLFQLMQHYTTTSPMAAIIYNILIFFLYCLIGSIIYTSIEPGWTVADAVYFSAARKNNIAYAYARATLHDSCDNCNLTLAKSGALSLVRVQLSVMATSPQATAALASSQSS